MLQENIIDYDYILCRPLLPRKSDFQTNHMNAIAIQVSGMFIATLDQHLMQHLPSPREPESEPGNTNTRNSIAFVTKNDSYNGRSCLLQP